jgi:hypothetical protein
LEHELKTSAYDENGVETANHSRLFFRIVNSFSYKRLHFELWHDIWQHLMHSSVGSALLKPLTIFLAKQGKNGSLQLIKKTFFFGLLSCPRSNSSYSYGNLPNVPFLLTAYLPPRVVIKARNGPLYCA